MPPAPPPPARPRSMAQRHARVWSLLVGALLATSGLAGAVLTWRDTVRGVEALQQARAAAAAERIGHFIAAIEQPLRWAVADGARDGDTPPIASLQLELLTLLRRVPALTELAWIDGRGRERLALSRLAMDRIDSGADRSAEPLLQAARQAGRAIGGVDFVRGSAPVMALALAPHRDGPVLAAGIDLKAVHEIVRQVQPGQGGSTYLVDSRGQLLSHPDMSRVLRRSDLSALAQVRAALAGGQPSAADDARGLDGVPVLAAAAAIPALGWTVIVEQPRSAALAPVWRALAQSAALLGLGILLAIGASVLLARRLARPIKALQQRAAAIASGDLAQRITLQGDDEQQALAEQFNQMAASLQSSYATLESRVAERTLALAEANQAKSRFLAAASHDLRQPVHALGLFVAQLRQARDAEAQRRLLGQVEAAAEAFETLLEALLDISRLDAGGVAVQRAPLALLPLLARLADGSAETAAAQGLQLRLRAAPLWVDSDAVLLERILANLLGNALRYTRRGGVLLACRPRAGGVELRVVDTGPGIAEDQQPRVFQEFVRLPGSAGPGLGLGLAIVQRLCALLGHGLRLRSRPGFGSSFVLQLPLAAPLALAAPALAGPADEPLAGLRVLVVDDDPAVCEAMAGLLQQWGCKVALAANGTQAHAALAAAPPALLITDLQLADGEDGLALALALTAARAAAAPGSALRTVVLSAETAPERLQAARATGWPVLAKPLRPARLRALLESMFGQPG